MCMSASGDLSTTESVTSTPTPLNDDVMSTGLVAAVVVALRGGEEFVNAV